jgi:DNA-binding transcriptional MocR family regulator
VIYVSSFSKTLAPGLRVGYLAASAERVAWMTTHRAINSIASSHLAERMVYRLLTEGNYRHHCEQLRTRLVDVRADVVASLRSHGFHIEHDPLAGLYVWADLGDGVDAFPIAQRMLDAGHLVAPGQVFARSMKSHMRFNVATTLNSPSLPMLRALVDETIRA